MNPKVWSDIDDIDTLKSLPDTAMHRNIEKIIESAAAEHGDRIKCAIICSCGVYGTGHGLGNTQSALVPLYWEHIKTTKRAFYANSGTNTRSWVHIDDLVQVYLKLVEAAVAGGGIADWGREVRDLSTPDTHLFTLHHMQYLMTYGLSRAITSLQHKNGRISILPKPLVTS